MTVNCSISNGFSIADLPSHIFNLSPDGVMLTDSKRNIIDINPKFESITGYSRSEIIGNKPSLLSSGLHDLNFYNEMSIALENNGNWCGDIWNRHKNGKVYLENLSVVAIGDKEKKPLYYLGIIRDITEKSLYKEKLKHESLYDPLTNLPNRKLLTETLTASMAQSKSNDQKICVFYVDLDGFKQINDEFGHHSGDKVLVEISKNFQKCINNKNIISRIGGDEFAGVLQSTDKNYDFLDILNQILLAATKPISIKGKDMTLSASLGVTFWPQSEDLDGEQLLRQADFAMYQAKQNGKNRLQLFNEDKDIEQRKFNAMIKELKIALENEEFVLHYQPKLDMKTNTLMGVEALIRWNHPTRGLLSPVEFLPFIEDHPLLIELGCWVIERALKQISKWKREGIVIPVSVNIASIHIHQKNFVETLHELLIRYDCIGSKLLELEILETSILNDLNKVTDVIYECKKLGVIVSLDDFGSGYSSLSYLRKLPVSVLKVDRSFTRNILHSSADLSIFEAVMALASAFNCKVIAEGVESEEQGLMLLKLGCSYAQGYFIAKPMPEEMFAQWVKCFPIFPHWVTQEKIDSDKLQLMHIIVDYRGWLKKNIQFLVDTNNLFSELKSEKSMFLSWYPNALSLSESGAVNNDIYDMHNKINLKLEELKIIRNTIDINSMHNKVDELVALSEHFLSKLEKEKVVNT